MQRLTLSHEQEETCMKRTNVLPTVIVYLGLVIAALSTFFIDYTNEYTSNIVKSLSVLTLVVCTIGLIRLRKLK
jgi:uncharacterized membrane protein